MSLKAEIDKFQKDFIPHVPKDILKVIMEETEKLVSSGLAKNSLQKGDKVPVFTLPNVRGEKVSAADLLKQGPLVISFYRGGWCPYCNLEIKELQRAFPEMKALGANLIAISPELPDKSVVTAERHELGFEVLCDVTNKVTRKFGLVFTLAEELRPLYKKFNFDLPASNGDESYEIPFPATYIIDSGGTIIHAFVNADYTKRMEPSEIVKVLKSIKK